MEEERTTLSSTPTSPVWAPVDDHIIIHIPIDTIDHTVPTPMPERHQSPPPAMQSQLQQQPHSPPRRRNLPTIFTTTNTASVINIPPYNRRQSGGGHVRRYFGTYRENWSFVVHGLMLLVLLCIFLLWWFSTPVTLTIKDGRIIAKPAVDHEKAASLNDTELTLSRMAILAVATSPNPNIQFILSILGQADHPSPLNDSLF